MGLVNDHPLDDWGKLGGFRWPDPNNPAFYEGMEKKLENPEDKYLLTGIFMLLFERTHALRGFENTLEDLYLERERIEMLADRIVEYDLAVIGNISSRFPGAIQGFSFSDDWGTERQLMIRPALWREFFKPRYKKIFDACKSAGWHVWMHSCGKVNEILGDLIDMPEFPSVRVSAQPKIPVLNALSRHIFVVAARIFPDLAAVHGSCVDVVQIKHLDRVKFGDRCTDIEIAEVLHIAVYDAYRRVSL
jgi:hypothetical protein